MHRARGQPASRTVLMAVMAGAIGVAPACGSDSQRAPPGSPEVGTPDLGQGQVTLEPPDPPDLTPCPTGWLEVPPIADGEPATCNPWPGGAAATCPAGQVQLPGEAACAPLGAACPDGLWADDLPADRPVLYVQPGAQAGGDGSRDAPFARVSDALAAVDQPDTVVALSRGVIDEAVVLTRDVELRGACAAETRIAPTRLSGSDGGGALAGDALPATLTVTGATATLRDLQLGGPGPGLWVAADGHVALAGVAVLEASFAAIVVDGGRLSADRLQVADTALIALPGAGTAGVGLAALGGAQISLGHAIFERNQLIALFAREPGTTVELADSVVRETQAGGLPDYDGAGLALDSGAHGVVRRTVFEENAGSAMEVQLGTADDLTADPALDARDVVVRGAAVAHATAFSAGLRVSGRYDAPSGDSAAVVERAFFDGVQGEAMRVGHAHLAATDVLVRDVAPYGTDEWGEAGGFGLLVGIDGEAALERVAIEEAHSLAIWVVQGSSVTGADLTVAKTRQSACGAPCAPYGIGLVAQGDGSTIDLTRFQVAQNDLAGVLVAQGADLSLSDGAIAENPIGLSIPDGRFDYHHLAPSVVFRDNDRNLDSHSLPLPDPGDVPALGSGGGPGSLGGGPGGSDADGGGTGPGGSDAGASDGGTSDAVAGDAAEDAGPTCVHACGCCGESWEVTLLCQDDSPAVCGTCPCGTEDVRVVDAPEVSEGLDGGRPDSAGPDADLSSGPGIYGSVWSDAVLGMGGVGLLVFPYPPESGPLVTSSSVGAPPWPVPFALETPTGTFYIRAEVNAQLGDGGAFHAFVGESGPIEVTSTEAPTGPIDIQVFPVDEPDADSDAAPDP